MSNFMTNEGSMVHYPKVFAHPNHSQGTSPTWKWDIQQFFLRFPFGKGIDSGFQTNMFGDLQDPNTQPWLLVVWPGWIPGHFFFWGGISLKYPHCEYFTLRQFFRWRNPESFCLTFSTFGWSTNSYLDVWGSVVFACGSKWGTPKIGWWSFIYLSSCLRLI
jgi:hypothetical protein